MKGLILFIIVITLLIIGVVIGAQNDQLVTVNYLIAQATMRLSTLMAIVACIGLLIGILAMVMSWISMRLQLSLVVQKLKKYRSE